MFNTKKHLLKAMLSILCLAGSSIPLLAQSVQWSEPLDKKQYHEFGEYLGSYNNQIYTIVNEGSRRNPLPYLTTFSTKDLAFQSKVELPIIANGASGEEKRFTIQQRMLVRGTIYQFLTQYQPDNDRTAFYVQKYGSDGKVQGKMTLLGDCPALKKRKQGTFYMQPSIDSMKWALVILPAFDKYAGETISYRIYDDKFTALNKFTATMPYRDKDFTLESIELDADNDIFMLAKVAIPKSDREKGEDKFYYDLISISPNSNNKVKEYDLKLKGYEVADIKFKQNGKDELIVAGFYREKDRNHDYIKGMFYLSFDTKANVIKKKSTKDFSQAFIDAASGTKDGKKGFFSRNRGVGENYVIKQFIPKEGDKGGVYLVAEDQFVNVVTTTDSKGNSRTTYYYNSHHILIANVDGDGKIGWLADIPKRQITANDGGIMNSYILTRRGDNLSFIFNENRKNIDNNYDAYDIKTMNSYKKAVPVVVTVDKDGKTSRKILYEPKEVKVRLLTMNGKSNGMIRQGEHVVVGLSGGSGLFSRPKPRVGILKS